MNLKNIVITASVLLSGLPPQVASGQFDKLRKQVQAKVEETLDGDTEGRTAKLMAKFEASKPISTTFDDAIYEADFLGDFDPKENEYRPLDIQPRADRGGYRLQSGLYTMNARSFCLRSSTYGPSRGDGHLPKEKYMEALAITEWYYFAPINDCVSYADDVADLLGLITPRTHNIVLSPHGYIKFLVDNNLSKGSTDHPLCKIKPSN